MLIAQTNEGIARIAADELEKAFAARNADTAVASDLTTKGFLTVTPTGQPVSEGLPNQILDNSDIGFAQHQATVTLSNLSHCIPALEGMHVLNALANRLSALVMANGGRKRAHKEIPRRSERRPYSGVIGGQWPGSVTIRAGKRQWRSHARPAKCSRQMHVEQMIAP